MASDNLIKQNTDINDVQNFWNTNPLFTGEVDYDSENPKEFFDKHDNAYFNDVFRGITFDQSFYTPKESDVVLDLGCGIGFWSSLFSKKYNVKNLTSADLSEKSLEICKQRVPSTKILQENAEKLSFEDNSFNFINCQGVIHHTPNTQACINEIYRILKEDGKASISVYYDNILLRLSSIVYPLIKTFIRLFLRKNTGRGRDFTKSYSKDEIVRLYDGSENPIGKSYSKSKLIKMLKDGGFNEIEIKYYFFPFRFIKFKLPIWTSKFFVKLFPFMIIANLKK